MLDPLFLHELALELNMTVAELQHGRGTPTPLHELTVAWPAYFAYRNREQERADKEAERQAEMDRRRI